MRLRSTKQYFDKPIYEYFDDSEIEDDSDIESEGGERTELDETVEIDHIGDVDPLEIESLLEEAERNAEQNYTEKSEIKWKKEQFDTQMILFEPAEEPTLEDVDNLRSPFQYFKNYFTDELFENFARYTNIYAEQQNVKSFKTTDSNEIKVLFGLHMLMGIVKLPRVSMYWSHIWDLKHFKDNMTCDRFFQLRTNLHIVNNLEKPNDNKDKYYKVRPLLTAVRNRLLQFQVGEIVSVDEQMIPLKNRLDTKQYIKEKLIRWGVKVFVLCGKDGIPYDFFVYQGSTTELSPTRVETFGFCASTVLHLADRLHNRGHKLYFDNYFSSYPLLEILKEKGINAGGTIRVDRFAKPPLLSDKEMAKKGRGYAECVVSENKKVVVVNWHDNKCVRLASNFVGIGTSDTAKRWEKKLKKHVDVSRPEIVSLYNAGMGGVDLLDQLISYYRVFIRSKKWPLRIIFHFVDFAICASWLEYRKDRIKAKVPKNRIKDLLNFRMEVTFAMLKVGIPNRSMKRGRPKSTPETEDVPQRIAATEVRPSKEIRLDHTDHLPEHDGRSKPTRCKKNKCVGRTMFHCVKCKVHLCITKKNNCFAEFHRNN